MHTRPYLDHYRDFSLQELGDILLEMAIISSPKKLQILKSFSIQKAHPIEIIGALNLPHPAIAGAKLDSEILTEMIAAYFDIPYIKIDPLLVSVEVITTLVSESYLKRWKILPLEATTQSITIATSNPHFQWWKQELENLLKRPVKVVFARPNDIEKLTAEFFSVHSLIRPEDRSHQRGERLLRQGKISELDGLIQSSKNQSLSTEDSATAKVVNWLLQYAKAERASDIHLEPKSGLSNIRFRIDGHLHTVYRMDPNIFLAVLSRIKILANMKVDEKRRPQDGRIKGKMFGLGELDLRLSTIPTLYGEKLVIRILDPEMSYKNFEHLGLLSSDAQLWESLTRSHHGLILVTGPTGSGKTTTLYTTLGKLYSPDINICTVEDPVEIVSDNFNQVQINKKLNVDFAGTIRSFLRQDPDILMVGEIRDQETGEMAAQAALTGHMVFSTLHTNNALSSIIRLVDLGVPTYLINSTLRAVLAQRLVRRLCSHCKEASPLDRGLWETLLDNQVATLQAPTLVFQKRGCEKCKHTGYLGRICIYELLVLDQSLKSCIRPGVELSDLESKALHKFQAMHVMAAKRLAEGIIDFAEIFSNIS